MLVHIFLVIYVFYHETGLVQSGDGLDFWDRHVKDNARKTIEEKKHNNHLDYDHDNDLDRDNTQARSNGEKLKTTKPTDTKRKPVTLQRRSYLLRRSQDDHKEISKWPKLRTTKPTDTKRKPVTLQRRSYLLRRSQDHQKEISKWPKLRSSRPIDSKHKAVTVKKRYTQGYVDVQGEDKWPKIHKNRFKARGNIYEDVGSTRMTPVYLMQKEDTEDKTTRKFEETPFHYRKLSPYNIKNQLSEIIAEFPEANVTVEVIGRTVEYNDIVMLKASARKIDAEKYFRADESKYVDDAPEKKIIFIVHGLSVMGMTQIPCLSFGEDFKTLLSFYFAHLDKFDIFLIPMANPDGFIMNGIWNKNMSPQGACPGVALDRNFEVQWNSTPASSCSQHFPGLSPFSEPETRAIRDVLHHYSHKIAGYFHVHSGTYDAFTFKGDAVLFPKGYTDVQSDDDKYIDLKGEIEESMKNASFQVLTVTVDTLYTWYGKISGSSVDYASGVYGIPYALELVMQPWDGASTAIIQETQEDFSIAALHEIWKRIIDVIFIHISQHLKNGDQ